MSAWEQDCLARDSACPVLLESAQHEYLVRKERKTARIRTELESGTSSTSGNSNIAFPKTAKASSATYVSGPCLYCIPTTLASCCKRQPHFLGTWFPPSSASLGLPWKSTFSTFSFFTGQLELTIGSPSEVPVFPQQHIAIPDHWLQSGSGCITLTSTSSVQFTFPRAELKNAKVKAYIALKNWVCRAFNPSLPKISADQTVPQIYKSFNTISKYE